MCVFVSIERLENLNIENSFVSAAESCKDNIKNQDETDVDCGGNKCPKCEDEKICNENCDCLSRECKNYTCDREYRTFTCTLYVDSEEKSNEYIVDKASL